MGKYSVDEWGLRTTLRGWRQPRRGSWRLALAVAILIGLCVRYRPLTEREAIRIAASVPQESGVSMADYTIVTQREGIRSWLVEFRHKRLNSTINVVLRDGRVAGASIACGPNPMSLNPDSSPSWKAETRP
jgi:hypothetical protein